jgi:transcription termination factor Rho
MTVTQPTQRTADDAAETAVNGIVAFTGSRGGTLRLHGYRPHPDDVRIPPALIARHDLRPGDEVTGVANPNNRGLVRVDTIHGMPPEKLRRRPDFAQMAAMHPEQRLRLETEPHVLTTRVIDLVMPIGKGQRALIVSPPKAGKTMILQAIANGVTRNHPECHLMVVLVDERPEEVTEIRRSVRGEVVASTFDRPPTDHIATADLAIERAKRLVELGRDVVVLLDSLTRLGRAHNNAAPSGGRTMTGGIDTAALQAPKRLLGAARNTDGGGTLTIIASALVDTGSAGDGVLFEEYKGTGNAELRLDRRIAERRVFPAIDVTASGTRREELLLAPDELNVVRAVRRAVAQLPPGQALDQLLDHLKRTRSNAEFLHRLAAGGRARAAAS